MKYSLRYDELKNQWESILKSYPESQGQASSDTMEASDVLAGDEKEGGDISAKVRERRYRVEKDVVRTDRTVPFFSVEKATTSTNAPNSSVISFSPSEFLTSSLLTPRHPLVMLRNTLMSHTMHDFPLGYVQGMSDLLAPILAVQGEEVGAFWCFESVMTEKVQLMCLLFNSYHFF